MPGARQAEGRAFPSLYCFPLNILGPRAVKSWRQLPHSHPLASLRSCGFPNSSRLSRPAPFLAGSHRSAPSASSIDVLRSPVPRLSERKNHLLAKNAHPLAPPGISGSRLGPWNLHSELYADEPPDPGSRGRLSVGTSGARPAPQTKPGR